MPSSPNRSSVVVWDIWVRLFHWLLVAAVLTAAYTGLFGAPKTLTIHLVAGSTIAALLFCRLLWGVLGGGYARLASFAYGPRTILAYLHGLRGGTSRRYLGHNPLGSIMVFALLGVLALIVTTGVITLGGQDKQGPLAAFTPFAVGWSIRGIHKLLALLVLAMVVFHLGGVLFESRHEHENLTAAMITGRKRPEPGLLPPQTRSSPKLALALIVIFGGIITAGVAALAALPGLGVPPATLDPDYDRECTSCHGAFHPSLLPLAAGQSILDDLKHHFGNDASLDPAIAARIRTYMAANSAEHWDTLPAVMFRQSVNPKDPRRITATGFWQRRHHDIPDAVFAGRRVNGRSSCDACHSDAATGRFAPQNIEIPAP
jgi:cytochrome b